MNWKPCKPILCDNEDANTLEEQCAVEVQAEWANEDWEPVRFYGVTVAAALANAVRARSIHMAIPTGETK